MIWPWIIAQLLMVLYIRFASWHHAPAVNAMREYVPTPNPYEDPFHTYSFLQAATVTVIISLGLFAYETWIWCGVMAIVCGLWYSLLFDPWLNKGTYKNWDYLGDDSSFDRWFKKKFGKHAGQEKAIFIAVLILITNILKFIF